MTIFLLKNGKVPRGPFALSGCKPRPICRYGICFYLYDMCEIQADKIKEGFIPPAKIESSFFHINTENLAKLFNLIYYLMLIPTPTLTSQISPNPIRKPQIKCARMKIAHCFFTLLNNFFW